MRYPKWYAPRPWEEPAELGFLPSLVVATLALVFLLIAWKNPPPKRKPNVHSAGEEARNTARGES